MVHCSNCGSACEDQVQFCRVCGTPLSPADPADVGGPQDTQTVGRYRLVGLIGSGASGRVWLAYGHEELPVAIKALSPYLVDTAGFLDRFRSEAQIMAQMSHPHVVRLHEYFENSDGAWVVMEYVKGSSLRAVEDHAHLLGPEQALGVLSGALSGLGYAHDLGLIHGDLKPENILVDTGGDSKLADFGEVVSSGSAEPTLGGTPAYMSPESVRGGPLDPRSDLYSAGVVLYEALAGRPPFRATNDLALLRMQVHEEPPPIENLPPSVDLLLRRSLAKDPDLRPQSANEFISELEEAARSGYGADWVARASVTALVAATTVVVASLAAAGPGISTGATVGGTQLGGTTTGTAGPTPLSAAASQASLATTPVRKGIFHKLGATKLGGLIGAHPVASLALAGVLVAGAAAGGVAVATKGTAPSTETTTTTSTVSVPQTATWSLRSVPAGVSVLSSVACPTKTHCYAVGDLGTGSAGVIIASSDGGATWQSQAIPTLTAPTAPTAVSCPSSTTCIAVGAYGPSGEVVTALVTQNGGTEWKATSAFPSDVGTLSDISCPSINLCVAVGSANVQTGGTPTILRTSDLGVTWTTVTPPPSFESVYVVSCPTVAFCMIGGNGGVGQGPLSSVSVDGGQTWTLPVVSGDQGWGPEGLICTDAEHCIELNTNTNSAGTGVPYISDNSGRTWAPTGSTSVGDSVSCADRFCMLIGTNPSGTGTDKSFLSTDGGRNWSAQILPQNPGITGIACAAQDHCVAVGNGGNHATPSPVIMTYSP